MIFYELYPVQWNAKNRANVVEGLLSSLIHLSQSEPNSRGTPGIGRRSLELQTLHGNISRPPQLATNRCLLAFVCASNWQRRGLGYTVSETCVSWIYLRDPNLCRYLTSEAMLATAIDARRNSRRWGQPAKSDWPSLRSPFVAAVP